MYSAISMHAVTQVKKSGKNSTFYAQKSDRKPSEKDRFFERTGKRRMKVFVYVLYKNERSFMRKLALSDEILMSVDKAARYIGGEVNAVMKDKNRVDIRFCMCFPDVCAALKQLSAGEQYIVSSDDW